MTSIRILIIHNSFRYAQIGVIFVHAESMGELECHPYSMVW